MTSFIHISSKTNNTLVREIKANFILNLFWAGQFCLDQITVCLGLSNYLFWFLNFWAKFFTLVSHITVSVEVGSVVLLLWWNIGIPGVVVYLCVFKFFYQLCLVKIVVWFPSPFFFGGGGGFLYIKFFKTISNIFWEKDKHV